MKLRPCYRCRWVDGCELKEHMRAALLAAPIPVGTMRPTTVSFRCAKRLEGLHVGARAVVSLPETVEVGPADYYSGEPDLEEITVRHCGTVTEHLGTAGRVRVWLDEPTTAGKTRIRVWPNMVEPIDQPDRVVCRYCATPAGLKSPDFFCPDCDPEDAKALQGTWSGMRTGDVHA